MIKRILSTGIGIMILIVVMFSNSIHVFNLALSIICLLGMHELYNAFKSKGYRPISIVGYLVAGSVFFVNSQFVPYETLRTFLIEILPVIFFLLFSVSLLSKGKISVLDVSITMFGLIYIPFFLMFLTLTRQLKCGEYLVWFIFGGAWVTDSFAYLIGRKIGKHKFSKISPNKSIEGAIAGIIFSAMFFGGYTYYLGHNHILEISVILMTFMGILVSVISQVGDLIASSVKRFCGIKDFGKIMPGHGGVLDRFDSVIMIAPFVYMILHSLI